VYVELYSEKYRDDVVEIINNFYREAWSDVDMGIDKDQMMQLISDVGKSKAFLLIVDDRCQGVLAGIEVPGLLNKKRTFQEIAWYVNLKYRTLGVMLLKKVQDILKEQGFEKMIMGVLENCKTDKIKALYERMGFKAFETQYIKAI
jgi:hypothetical protein